MTLPDYQNWLEQRLKRDRRGHLAIAALAALFGAGITGLSVVVATAAIYAFLRQTAEIVYGFWAWKLPLPDTPLLVALIALFILLLQLVGSRRADGEFIFHLPQVDWHDSLNALVVLGAIRAMLMDLIYAGPRLLRYCGERVRARRSLREIDQAICAAVLQALHRKGHRMSFEQLAEKIPGFETARHHPQMLRIRGVLDLHSEPPGLALSTELKTELTEAARAAGDPGAEILDEADEEWQPADARLDESGPAEPDSALSPEELRQRARIRKRQGPART